MHVANLLDANTSGLQSPAYGGLGYWTATDADLARTTKRAHSGIASIQITATGNTAYVYSGDSTTIAELVPVNRTNSYRVFLWFHHETVNRSIRVGLQFYNATQEVIAQTPAHYSDFEMSFRDWTLASLVVDVDDIPVNAVYVAVKIKFEVDDVNDKIDSKLWIDDVVLYQPEDITEEPIVKRLSRWIPEYMVEEDGNQTNPVNPMLLYLDVASATLGHIYKYIDDFGYGTVGNPDYPLATSTLTDPSGYPESGTQTEWLQWLSQLVGMRSTAISDTSSGTNWFFLEANYTDWDEWETDVNLDVTSYSTSWTSITRTDGAVTVIVTSHGFVDGDVFTITGASDTSLNGQYEVSDAPNSTDIHFSQIYPILSLSQSTTTVTVTTGVAHNLSIGDSIEIDGTYTIFDGTTQTVATVSQTVDSDVDDVLTFTAASGSASSTNGVIWPSDLLIGETGTIGTDVDLNWASIEGVNAYPLTPPGALAEFIRTGASGIWAGTIDGMKRAARLSLSGLDEPVTIERNQGYLKITSTVLHELSVGDFIEIYASPYPELGGVYTVHSVVDAHSFKVEYDGGYLLTRGWATTKKVQIEKKYWNGVIESISSASGVVTITFQQLLPVLSSYEILGSIVVTGTSNNTLNATFGSFVSGDVTISSDRRTITFDTTAHPSSVGTIAQLNPVSANAKLHMSDNSFYLIKTLSSQTTGPEAVLTFVDFAKPAGSAITHKYI